MKDTTVRASSCQGRDGIILSPAILEHLPELKPAALRAYVYLCSRNSEGTITASVPAISGATGQSNRTTVDALQALTGLNLISRVPGIGAKANEYRVTLGSSSSSASPAPAAKVAARISTPANVSTPSAVSGSLHREQKPEGVAIPTSADSAPPPAGEPGRSEATLEGLITSCYRPLKTGELARLKSRFPSEELLKAKLTALRELGQSVEKDMDIDFLASVLDLHLSNR